MIVVVGVAIDDGNGIDEVIMRGIKASSDGLKIMIRLHFVKFVINYKNVT